MESLYHNYFVYVYDLRTYALCNSVCPMSIHDFFAIVTLLKSVFPCKMLFRGDGVLGQLAE